MIQQLHRKILGLTIALSMVAVSAGAQIISTVAGPETNAQLVGPAGVFVDTEGRLYITDFGNNRIRRVDEDGTITTVAGSGASGFSGDGGPATEAQLALPANIFVDAAGNLYIADANNNRIRRVDASGTITTVAGTGDAGYAGDGGPATEAQLSNPFSVFVDAAGALYIAERFNHTIRRVDASGTITTVAGNGQVGFSGDGGPATAAELNAPEYVYVDAAGVMYIADTENERIRRVDASGTITTFAGTGDAGFSGDGGPATAAELNHPNRVFVDGSGNLFIAEFDNHRIRKVDTNGIIRTVAGTGEAGSDGDGGPATEAQLNGPAGLHVDAIGRIYISDFFGNRIRLVEKTADFSGDNSVGFDDFFLFADNYGREVASDDDPVAAYDLNNSGRVESNDFFLFGDAFPPGAGDGPFDNSGVSVSSTVAAELSDVSSGESIEIPLAATGLDGVKQIEISVDVDPAIIDISSSAYTTPAGFIGVQPLEDGSGRLVFAAVNFLSSISGDASLGTITLVTSDIFGIDVEETIRLSSVRVGPSSNQLVTLEPDVQTVLNPAADPPSIGSIDPVVGVTSGGTEVTITGSGFQQGIGVDFGGSAATEVVFVDANTLRATAPGGSAGSVDIDVANPDGQSTRLTAGFTYVNPPLGGEYFIDADPGHALGTPITDGEDFTVPLDGLSPGTHTLYARFADQSGQWGLPAARRFYIAPPVTPPPALAAAEYYIDVDPGPGQGTAIAQGALGADGLEFSVALNGLDLGRHTLFVRFADADGAWSIPQARRFYLSKPIPAAGEAVRPITAFIVYFEDGDAVEIPVTDPARDLQTTIKVPLPDLGIGEHRIALEAINSDGTISRRTEGDDVSDRFTLSAADLPNQLTGIEFDRGHDRIAMRWTSRLVGLDDVVRFRALGEGVWRLAQNALLEEISQGEWAALLRLRAEGVDLADEDAIAAALTAEENGAGAAVRLRRANARVDTRFRQVVMRGLQTDTCYEYEARSIDLLGSPGPLASGTVCTRSAPDTRTLRIIEADYRAGGGSIALRWTTNRRANARYTLAGQTVALKDEGEKVHLAEIRDLEPGTEYTVTLRAEVPDAAALVAAGALSEEDARARRTLTVRTWERERPLLFDSPPVVLPGENNALVDLRFNQATVSVQVDYGPTDTQGDLYPFRVSSTLVSQRHQVELPELQPSTRYRYRVRAATAEGAIVDTDPGGNRQWSRDRRFSTAAEGDVAAPVLIEGPQAIALGGGYAEIRWNTDVDSRGRVFLGTVGPGGTLGTADQLVAQDLAPDGRPTFTHEHRVVFGGLDLSTRYGYCVESTGISGLSQLFDPTGLCGGAAKVLQPPGGSGTFVTRSQEDTDFPVILAGPEVTSRTHEKVVVEWTTDELADSEVSYGRSVLADRLFAGDNERLHKMVVDDLAVATTYRYTVGSTDASGNGATSSDEASFTTKAEFDFEPPVIVQGPAVRYKSERSVLIEWRTDEEATRQLEFGTTEELGRRRILLAPSRLHRFRLTNLSPDTQYFYRVSSTDLSDNLPTVSEILSFRTDTDPDLEPPEISGVQVVASRSTATMRWTTDEIADSFVNYSRSSGQAGKAAALQQTEFDFTVGDIVDVTEHEIRLVNLEPDTEYRFRVGSTDPADNPFAQSDELSFTTSATADRTPPAVPTGLAARAGPGRVNLSWDANAEDDLAGYTLWRGAVSGPLSPIAARLRDNAYVDLGLENDSVYVYALSALDALTPANESGLSDRVQATPTLSAGPGAPAELQVIEEEEDLQPTLVFSDATPFVAGAALTYTVQVSTQADFSDVTAAIAGLPQGSGDAGTGRSAWTLSRQLEKGRVYYWRVRAVEGEVPGPFSASAEFSTAAPLTGDFNGDGSVDFGDFFLFVDAFNQEAVGDNALFDMDGQGEVIDFGDFFIFTDNFGRSVAGKGWAVGVDISPTAELALRAEGGSTHSDRYIEVRVSGQGVETANAFGLVLRYDATATRFVGAAAAAANKDDVFGVLAQAPGEVVVGGGLAGDAGGREMVMLEFLRTGPANNVSFSVEQAYIGIGGGRSQRVRAPAAVRLLPQAFTLGHNFPNPFNPTTTIEFGLPQAGPVTVEIYDVLGRRLRRLVRDETYAAGYYAIEWDGRDDAGRRVGSGTYLYRLETGEFGQTRKMLLLK